MRWHGKVVWSEGMFLRTQHFQQQDRYLENIVRESVGNSVRFGWGFRTLALDEQMLTKRRLSVANCTGLMPDGTPFDVPADQDPPAILEIGEDIRETVVHLAILAEQPGAVTAEVSDHPEMRSRFQAVQQDIADTSDRQTGSEAKIRVGHLRLWLLLDNDNRPGFLRIPMARIQEVSPNGKITLDPKFIPTCLDFRASARLRGFVEELEGLLHQRGEALSGAGVGPEQGTVGELANFMLLQVINRHEPLIRHLCGDSGLHPEALFRLFLNLAGELATFFTKRRRPPAFEAYRHDDLTRTFGSLWITICEYLSTEFVRRAVPIPLRELPKYGLFTGMIHDRTLLDTASFILVVTADMDPAEVARRFPDQSKAGASEQISKLVNYALPGIPIRTRPTAPRQIPFNTAAAYFELDKNSPHWRELEKSGGLSFHVAGQFPNLKLELYAIRPVTVDM